MIKITNIEKIEASLQASWRDVLLCHSKKGPVKGMKSFDRPRTIILRP